MRARSPVMSLGLVGIMLLSGAATAAGCGDDSGSGSTPDASSSDAPLEPPSSGDASSSAHAPDLVVYTGTKASLDASSSAGSTFAWSVVSAPPGSAVTTASLQGATTARPSFVADVSGDYVLSLSVTGSGSPATATVRVKAVPAPIFYTLTNAGEQPPYYEIRTIGADGTGAHAVTCRESFPVEAGTDANDGTNQFAFLAQAMLAADVGIDWWEAPAGQPSRAAFQEFSQVDGGTFTLSVGTTESTCQNAPKQVHAVTNQVPEGGSRGNQPGIFQPRFSPDGTRIAYIEQRPDGEYIAIVGYDGNDYRLIGTLCATAGGSCSQNDGIFPPRPQWIDSTTIGWARSTNADGGTNWEILAATDSANPSPHRYMTCDGVLPLGIAFLKDGSVLANMHASGAAQDLFLLAKPATPGAACQIVRNYTALPNANSYARDFSVSPDGTVVAFVRHTEADGGDAGSVTFGGELYAAPINGATPAAPLVTPAQPTFFGPRYIAGGAFVSYNGTAPLPDGSLAEAGLSDGGDLGTFDGGAPAINVVPAAGGAVPVFHAATSDVGKKSFVLGGGNGGGCGFHLTCTIAERRAGAAGGLSAVALAGLLAFRRRRRS